MTERVVALLGRRDSPTDAVEEYCTYLAGALRQHEFELTLERMNWAEPGWAAALSELREKARGWSGQRVLLQYTALAWSRRGFPAGVLRVLRVLREAGARVGVVYHDVDAYGGERVIDQIRRGVQLYVMRRALQASALGIVTVPREKLAWLRRYVGRVVFIPVGANLPDAAIRYADGAMHQPLTIAVYGITGGEPGDEETRVICEATRMAAENIGKLRLRVFGRGAWAREGAVRARLRDAPVETEISDVIRPEDVAREMCGADVLLFVRGTISSRRGSAIAGIACGLPVVASAGPETAAPVTEAGVAFVARGDASGTAEALARVLGDEAYRKSLAQRSRSAFEQHFSWAAIAERYAEALRSVS